MYSVLTCSMRGGGLGGGGEREKVNDTAITARLYEKLKMLDHVPLKIHSWNML